MKKYDDEWSAFPTLSPNKTSTSNPKDCRWKINDKNNSKRFSIRWNFSRECKDIRNWIDANKSEKSDFSQYGIITRFFKCLQLVQNNLLVVVGQFLPTFHIFCGVVDSFGTSTLFRERVEQTRDVMPGRHQFAVGEEARHILGDPYLALFDRAFAPLAFRAACFRAFHGERFFLFLLLSLFVTRHDVRCVGRGWNLGITRLTEKKLFLNERRIIFLNEQKKLREYRTGKKLICSNRIEINSINDASVGSSHYNSCRSFINGRPVKNLFIT